MGCERGKCCRKGQRIPVRWNQLKRIEWQEQVRCRYEMALKHRGISEKDVRGPILFEWRWMVSELAKGA